MGAHRGPPPENHPPWTWIAIGALVLLLAIVVAGVMAAPSVEHVENSTPPSPTLTRTITRPVLVAPETVTETSTTTTTAMETFAVPGPTVVRTAAAPPPATAYVTVTEERIVVSTTTEIPAPVS